MLLATLIYEWLPTFCLRTNTYQTNNPSTKVKN